MSIKPKIKKIMAQEILKYPVYMLNKKGQLVQIPMPSLEFYNHNLMHLHHYIPFSSYVRFANWYADRGIEQKLILMPISIHEQVHHNAIHNLSDREFYNYYKISRWDLIFNKKHYKEGV